MSNGERFFHYSAHVDSNDAWCVLLDAIDAPDEYVSRPLVRPAWQSSAPHGFREYLRPDAFKQIVVISDDTIFCYTKQVLADLGGSVLAGSAFKSALFDHPEFFYGPDSTYIDGQHSAADVSPLLAGERFDAALTAREPELFGSPGQGKYRVHSIVNFVGDRALYADEPMVTTCTPEDSCTSSLAHQGLSIVTGGLRYPISRYQDYDEIFHELAKDTIATAQLSCAWPIPPPPDGEVLDPSEVNLVHQPEGRDERVIPKAKNGECGDGEGWLYDDEQNPTQIEACPNTCRTLRADPSGSVQISFGCATVVVL